MQLALRHERPYRVIRQTFAPSWAPVDVGRGADGLTIAVVEQDGRLAAMLANAYCQVVTVADLTQLGRVIAAGQATAAVVNPHGLEVWPVDVPERLSELVSAQVAVVVVFGLEHNAQLAANRRRLRDVTVLAGVALTGPDLVAVVQGKLAAKRLAKSSERSWN